MKKVLEDAVDRTPKAYRQSDRFRVYDRAGERCRTPRCTGSIAQRTQGGRTSYYCPTCQR
jgi:formamidopyrimidine-DNA glycosylase